MSRRITQQFVTRLQPKEEQDKKKIKTESNENRKKEDDYYKHKEKDMKYLGFLNIRITNIKNVIGGEEREYPAFTLINRHGVDHPASKKSVGNIKKKVSEGIIKTLLGANPELEFDVVFVSVEQGSIIARIKVFVKDKSKSLTPKGMAIFIANALIVIPAVGLYEEASVNALKAIANEATAMVVSEETVDTNVYMTSSGTVLEISEVKTNIKPGVFIVIEDGDTLLKVARLIVKLYKHWNVTENQILMALFQINSSRFSGSIHELRKDITLRIPTLEEIEENNVDVADKFRNKQRRIFINNNI